MNLRAASLCLLIGLVAVASTASAQEKTYAERLGWGPKDRVIIFHSDDAGMSHGSNLGTMQAMENGAVTSASIMMPCGWVPEFIRYVKANPETDAGIHVTLTSEWDLYRWGPVAGKPAVPSIVDADGYLPDGVREVAEKGTADDVEREIRAQLEKARNMGITPTHLDTHMGTVFAKPEFTERYYKVGIEEQIPVLALGGHLTFASKEEDPEVIGLARAQAEKVWEAGLPVLDDLHTESYGWKEGPKTERFIEMVRNMKPGVMQVIVHCSAPTDEHLVITPSAPLRYEDTNAMVDPALRKALEDENVILTTWRELKERRDKVGKVQP